ncbi:hypothetical protein D3C73_1605460 [compost metagenome]
MKVQEFITEFEEILTVDQGTVKLDSKLKDIDEWDSLAKIALDVFLEDEFNIKLDPKTIEDFELFSDILNLVKDQLEIDL